MEITPENEKSSAWYPLFNRDAQEKEPSDEVQPAVMLDGKALEARIHELQVDIMELDRQIAKRTAKKEGGIDWTTFITSGLFSPSFRTTCLQRSKEHKIAEWERLTGKHYPDDFPSGGVDCP